MGTFYRSAEPGGTPFVTPGAVVTVGQQLAIVEAMKLMVPVDADCAGRVQAVLADDGDPVEYGQALVVIEPEEPTEADPW